MEGGLSHENDGLSPLQKETGDAFQTRGTSDTALESGWGAYETNKVVSRTRWTRILQHVGRLLSHIKDLICYERINVLLIFVPIGIAVGFVNPDPIVVFILNALAIIPLAVIISTATESLASRLGDTIGALLNVTVGNTAELMIFFTALSKDQIQIVQSSLLGSILANLLVVLGTAFVCGEYHVEDQAHNAVAGRMSIGLLDAGLIASLLPVPIFIATNGIRKDKAHILALSRNISATLITVYIGYLLVKVILGARQNKLDQNVGLENEDARLPLSNISPMPSADAIKPTDHMQTQSKSAFATLKKWVRDLTLKRKRKKKDSVSYTQLTNHDDTEIVLTHRDRNVIPHRTPLAPPRIETKAANEGDFYLSQLPFSPPNTAPLDNGSFLDTVGASKRQSTPLPMVTPPSPPSTPASSCIGNSTARTSFSISRDNSSRSSLDADHLAWTQHPHGRRSPVPIGTVPTGPTNSKLKIPLPAAIAVLILSTSIVSISTELAVDAIPAIVDSWKVSHILLGFIVLPIVGNAAEHITAAKLAVNDKMVLAKSVAVESSTQVVLLITPAVVLIGWLRGRDMSLLFDGFEVGCIVLTAVVVSFVVCLGRSDWKRGCLLLGMYSVFALVSIFYRGQ